MKQSAITALNEIYVNEFPFLNFSRIQIEGKNIGGSQSLLQLSHHVMDK